MRRWAPLLMAIVVVTGACTVEPLEDPGVGDLALTSIVYAADGSVLAEFHASENRVIVDYEDLPRQLIDAVVAIEDERFWQHSGVDLQAIARALVNDIVGEGDLQGGSTITQQYLKNTVLTPEVTLDRKLTEAALAVRLEAGVDKETILEHYLNTIYFGNSSYGVGAAAARYFAKSVDQLTLAESALLAAMIQAPSATDPYLNTEAAAARRRVVLTKMVELGWATEADAAAADAEPITVQPPRPAEEVRYPYFTEEVKRWLLDNPALGETATDRYNAVFRGGLHIYTTLVPTVQEAAEQAVAGIMTDLGPSAALAAVDPRTGNVQALVGGRNFYSVEDPVAQFNLATQGRRQPGSAFKPFVLATALEEGHTLDEVYSAGPEITIETDSGPWTVENYAGSNFGELSLLEATVFSVNVVYAQLVNVVGAADVVATAEAAGIRTPLDPFHSVSLGAQEVTPLEMASAYGTFAAEGQHVEPVMVTHIESSDGVNIYEAVPVVTAALQPATARTVTAALTQVVERGTGVQADIGRPVAGKTGTSQEYRDAWFVGYTPEMAAAVWVGFPQGAEPMVPPSTPYTVTGGTLPAQIWSRFASAALTGSFAILRGAETGDTVEVEIDLSTGFLAGPLCPRQQVARVQLPADAVPTVVCPIHNPTEIVSVGSVDVPSVINLDLGAAVSALAESGLQATIEYQDGGGLARNTVFNQVPSPGFPAQSGTIVRLIVAGPAPDSTVPSVLGFPSDQAVVELGNIGVGAKVVIEAESDPDDATRRSGVVWKQDPGPGGAATGTVTLWVNP